MHVSSTLRQLWRTARKTPITVALALISTLMVTLCDIVIPLITATAIDSATAADGGHSAGGVSITTVVVLLVVAALVRYLFQFGRRYTRPVIEHCAAPVAGGDIAQPAASRRPGAGSVTDRAGGIPVDF